MDPNSPKRPSKITQVVVFSVVVLCVAAILLFLSLPTESVTVNAVYQKF
jgi:hypothetical protein